MGSFSSLAVRCSDQKLKAQGSLLLVDALVVMWADIDDNKTRKGISSGPPGENCPMVFHREARRGLNDPV